MVWSNIKVQYILILIIPSLIFSGVYFLNIPTNLPKIEDTNRNFENLEQSFLDPYNSQVVQDLLSKDRPKTDPLLTEWIETGKAPAHILKIGSKSSVLLLVKDDPTLDQTISPIGSFKFGNFNLYWVHTTVNGPKDIVQLSENENVIRIVTDRSEEHTSELQSHWYISYAVFCLKKKKKKKKT